MKNVKKMIQAGLKKFTVITILGVFLMTSLIPVSAATKVSKIKWSAYRKTMYVGNAHQPKHPKRNLDGKQVIRRLPKSVQKELSHLSKQEKQRSHVT